MQGAGLHGSWVTWCRVQGNGAGCRVTRCRVQGYTAHGLHGAGCRVTVQGNGAGCRVTVQGAGCRVTRLMGYTVQGAG